MGIFDWLGADKPANEASKYIGQIPGATSKYLNPYIEAGKGALPTLQGQYGNLLNDPGGMINKIGAGYKQSPGFKFALEKALAGGNRAFAAGGMGGSPSSSLWGMETAEGLASQDYNQFLQNALSQYGLGLAGEQNIFNTGAGTAKSMADMIAQVLAQQGAYKYQGAQANQNMGGQLIGSIPAMIAAFAGG